MIVAVVLLVVVVIVVSVGGSDSDDSGSSTSVQYIVPNVVQLCLLRTTLLKTCCFSNDASSAHPLTSAISHRHIVGGD